MIPRTMRAAVLVAQREPLVVDEVELPHSLEVGQVLVKVHASGICGSQLGEISGVKGPDRHLPHLLGHEGIGTVLAVGPGVIHVAEGDEVVLHWRQGRGIEAVPPVYRWRGEGLNAGAVTTFNEYAIVSENRLTPVPAGLDRDVLPLFGCAVTTGFGVVVNDAKLSIAESVVVAGSGGVGLNMVQAARLVSAYPIVAIDLHAAKLDLAMRLGATHTIDANHPDVEQQLSELLAPEGADCFIDNTGRPDVVEMGYRVTGARGRIILVGVPRHDEKAALHTLPLHFGKSITGSHGGNSYPDRDIPRYLRLYQQGRLELASLITERYGLEQVNDALEAMRSGATAGRSLLLIGD